LPEYAKDIRLNLSTVLSEEGAPGLTRAQIWGIALASAFATRNPKITEALVGAVLAEPLEGLNAATIEASKAAATIMAMNNVYYRFTHLVEDSEFTGMPARLRMNVIGKPGIARVDFELMCLAVSAITGCGACIKSHVSEVKKAGIRSEGIQSSIRIASTISAAAQALSIG
jgi:lipoyl-dependent peroxiredoxin subunit D